MKQVFKHCIVVLSLLSISGCATQRSTKTDPNKNYFAQHIGEVIDLNEAIEKATREKREADAGKLITRPVELAEFCWTYMCVDEAHYEQLDAGSKLAKATWGSIMPAKYHAVLLAADRDTDAKRFSQRYFELSPEPAAKYMFIVTALLQKQASNDMLRWSEEISGTELANGKTLPNLRPLVQRALAGEDVSEALMTSASLQSPRSD